VFYLSICAIFRDEKPYLREWIEFHKLVGVERFFLYDNESTDGSAELLAPYVDTGEVVLHHWPPHPGQVPAYNDCILRHGSESRWIAFIDIDEFIFSHTGRPVPEVLKEYERWPAVGVNWAAFGTSGHVEKPPGLVVECYLYRWRNPRARRTIKSIVDPRRVESCKSPHYFSYLDGELAVDEQKRPIEGPDFAFTEESSQSLLRVNHYWTKSEEEFREKLSRRQADSGGGLRNQVPSRPGDLRDEAILRYLPALREALGADPDQNA
jgi:glycosyl transferase family 92